MEKKRKGKGFIIGGYNAKITERYSAESELSAAVIRWSALVSRSSPYKPFENV